jgi:hypothetical protein
MSRIFFLQCETGYIIYHMLASVWDQLVFIYNILILMSGTISAYKRCSFRLYIQLFVKGRTSYLRCLCLFAHSGVQHLLCCVFALFFFVLCTLGCQFCLDCPSVLSSIYSLCDSIKPCNNNGKWRVSLILITPLVSSNLHWWKNINHCSFGETLPYHILRLKYYFSIPAILGYWDSIVSYF